MDKPELAEKLMGRTKPLNQQYITGLGKTFASSQEQSRKNISPTKTGFSSHMGQTLNSMRRQSKEAFLKNANAYSQEDQIKQLMRRVKQKKAQLQKRAQENQSAKEVLRFEQNKNAKLQNDFRILSPDKRPNVLLHQAQSESLTNIKSQLHDQSLSKFVKQPKALTGAQSKELYNDDSGTQLMDEIRSQPGQSSIEVDQEKE